jgi:hypothetical protein
MYFVIIEVYVLFGLAMAKRWAILAVVFRGSDLQVTSEGGADDV